MSAKVSVSSKERVLSPKRKKDFKGQLIVLDEGLPGGKLANEANTRPSSGSKNVKERPSSGSLEVLKSEKDAASSQKGICNNPARPGSGTTGSGRTEKKLPTVKRKEQKHCTCNKDGCQYCSDLSFKIEKLAVDGTSIGDCDLKTRECMAPRVPPSQPPIAAIPSMFDGGDTLEEGDDSETSSSENDDEDDDDDDDDQGGNGNQGTANSSQASSVSKAPIELLSSFLAALMKGEYHEAQEICNQILEVEPDNPTCLEFRSTLQERIEQDEESDSSSDDDSEEDSDDPDDDDDSGEDSGNEADEDVESDDDIDVNKLNLLMGGVPIKKKN